MKKILLLSDTHGHLDEAILKHCREADEIWHAGDVGDEAVLDKLRAVKPLRGVYGNIDDHRIRAELPEDLLFECEGVKVFITHIGGFPGRYVSRVRKILETERPRLYICGHSHILKVIPDPKLKLLHINPGACGVHGFHQVRTLVRFQLHEGEIGELAVIELGKRSKN